ncbi:hypothetical protein MTR67_035288 [Solanum verrucosum]|uniref:Integrase catalytic domain-containing protein n=1 Tax=Solanum verrucosum TaxID=315347 RepID=A0AAF0U9A0_SOLVR|nr:hypothetical protein MTR67_035288 [Solanum verrucosum]
MLTTTPILTLPEGSKSYVIYCDASRVSLGCVLMQRGKKELNVRKRRCLEFLKDYDMSVHYHPGKENPNSDLILLQLKGAVQHQRVEQVKVENKKPGGMTQEIKIPTWKWEVINMDFITDRGPPFTSHFWKSFQKGLGTKVNLRTSFHPLMDGQAECTIQTLEDMLRACVIDFKGSWDDHLPPIEFAFNNSYHSSIQMAPYEALCGHRFRSPVCWFEVGEESLIRQNSAHDAVEKVQLIRDRLKTTKSH